MTANRSLFIFLMASGAAFGALCYLGIHYEGVVMGCANRIIKILDFNARLVQSTDHQLHMITGLKDTPVQFRIEGFNWIYANQATVVGVVMSSFASLLRKAIWLGVTLSLMAITHATLLVFFVAELLGHYVVVTVEIAAYGTIAFKLYRGATPLLLAGIWIACSREAVFVRFEARQASGPWIPNQKSSGERGHAPSTVRILENTHSEWALRRLLIRKAPTASSGRI